MSFSAAAVRAFEHAGWQQAASDYDATFARASSRYVEALLDAAEIGSGTRVLDVCCGTGVVTAAAAARGAEIAGVDFSAAMLGRARSAYPAIRFDEGDAEALPYPDKVFDAVVANFGLHHVPVPQQGVAEMVRVLRPGGRLAFTTWAEPAENIAWQLVFEGIRRAGNPNASNTPPSAGGLGSFDAVHRVLQAAGLERSNAVLEGREWRLSDATELVEALRRGTVRTAAVIAAQEPEAMPAIIAEIDRLAASYKDGDALAIPIVAILAWGSKPVRRGV